jgi:hypothetical protein
MSQKKHFREAVQGQVRIEHSTKTVLNQYGVMPALHHFYMAFAKKVMQLREKYSGPTMRSEVEALQVLWASRGLDVGVLDEIKGWATITGLPFRLDHSLLDGPDVLV